MSEQPPRFLPPVPDEPHAGDEPPRFIPPGEAPPARPVFTTGTRGGPTFAGRPLASIWQRLAAVIIDGLIALVLSVPVLIAILGADTFEDADSFGLSGSDGVVVSIVSAAAFLVVSLTMLRWDGRTPGKRTLGIQVVRQNGEPFDAQTMLIRQGLIQAFAGTLIPLFSIIDYGAALFDEQRRTIHDRAAGTRVVVDEPRRP